MGDLTDRRLADIREFFDKQDLAQQYNAHQGANKIELISMTEELVFSQDMDGPSSDGCRVRSETGRLHNPGNPGELAGGGGTQLDTDLTIAEQESLLGWLEDPDAPFSAPRCGAGCAASCPA